MSSEDITLPNLLNPVRDKDLPSARALNADSELPSLLNPVSDKELPSARALNADSELPSHIARAAFRERG